MKQINNHNLRSLPEFKLILAKLARFIVAKVLLKCVKRDSLPNVQLIVPISFHRGTIETMSGQIKIRLFIFGVSLKQLKRWWFYLPGPHRLNKN